MSWYFFDIYVHILSAIVIVGYGLFWFIITFSIKRKFGDVSYANSLLDVINKTLWPPLNVPFPFRIPFPVVGWSALVVLIASGISILMIQGYTLQDLFSTDIFMKPRGTTLAIKLFLVIVLGISLGVLTRRLSAWLIYLNMGVILLIVIVSVFLVY